MPTQVREFLFDSPKAASAAARAVSVELKNTFEHRSKSSIHTNKNVVLLQVVSEDEGALSASLAHYSRLFGLCARIAKDV